MYVLDRNPVKEDTGLRHWAICDAILHRLYVDTV